MQTVHAMMRSLFDYAGLYPPASLGMAENVRSYAAYRDEPRGEFMARLVIPVSRLDEFERDAAGVLPRDVGTASSDDAEHDESLVDPWRITALTAAAGDPALELDLDRIARFNDEHADPERGLAVIDAIELKADSARAIEAAVDAIPPDYQAFFELPWQERDVRGMVAAVAGEGLGAKVRTGGMSPDFFPPCDALARFIRACAQAEVPMKATAGLHHPVRHHHAGQNVTMHGFVNVVVAAALALTRRADEATVIQALEETDGKAFAFRDAAIAWRGREITLDDLEHTRERFFLSIGSCSIDEPVDDLRSLGLLDIAV